jgi:hypothetical protein
MIEFFKHLFGLCGEGHPSLLCALGLTPIIIAIKGYVGNTILNLKNLLKRFC